MIKRRAWKVPVEETLDYILGYTCVNDVSACGLQIKERQLTRSKGFDTLDSRKEPKVIILQNAAYLSNYQVPLRGERAYSTIQQLAS